MIVGLTGGIGSGKTTVSNFFKALGVPIYNSDIKAKQLMISSASLRKEIILLLGEEAYEGSDLNKKYISHKIFNDTSLLKKMNAIVHPAVLTDFINWAKEQDSSYVIQETALIFENAEQDFYDKVILVTAPQDIRIDRVVKRDGMERKNISDRIKNQLSDTEKIPLADFVIINTELKQTKLIVSDIHTTLVEY